MTPEDIKFKEHLEEASKIVATFPEWKRNVLGRALSNRRNYEISRWVYRHSQEDTGTGRVVLTYLDFE